MALASPPEHAPYAPPPRPFRVVRRTRETADTWTLALEPVQGAGIEPEPGQFAMLTAFGIGEAPISLSAAPLVHTVRAVGAVTRAICAARTGALIGVRGPLGNAWPLAEAAGADLVVIAGGIGLAPLRPAIRRALAARVDYGAVSILYGGRTPEDLLYTDELERLRGRFDVDLDVTVDAAGPDWHGKVGVVTQLVPRAVFDPGSAAAFVCGPEVMMLFAARALLDRGIPPERIWVSMERSMHCGVGLCGHCQLGPTLICRDGPVYRWDEIAPLLEVREL